MSKAANRQINKPVTGPASPTRPRAFLLSPFPFSLALLAGLTLVFFWKILLANLILSGVDVFLYFYPYKTAAAEALRQGRLPLWNPNLFMGAPLLANSQVGLFYPFNWLFFGLDAPAQVSWGIGLHIFLAGAGMWLFARLSLALRPAAALVAAILFAFGGYLGAQVEHVNQLQAAAWLPLLFLLYDLGRTRSRGWFWYLWLAPLTALVLFAGHTQTAFISMFGLGLYAVWQAIFEFRDQNPETRIQRPESRVQNTPAGIWTLKSGIWNLARAVFWALLPLAAAALLGAALAAVQLLPTAELSGLSIRSEGLTYREVVSFSLRPTALHFSLLPPLDVDLTQILGQAFSEWVAYLGMTGLALAGLGALLALWNAPARRFVMLCAAGLVLGLGLYSGPLYLVLYHFVPGFDLFRVPARWLLLYAFGASALAGFGWQALLTPNSTRHRLAGVFDWLNARRRRWILPALPLLGLVALIGWKTPPPLTLALWVLLAAASLLLIFLTLRPTAPAGNIARVLLFLLLIGELFAAARSLNYNQPTAPQAFSSMRNATAFLRAADPPDGETPPGRFLSLSGITYDPGDLHDLEAIFGDSLSDQALYNLIVATKEKEVLFFNLPMLYHLHSVDGYDGGILPLKKFINFQKLFLPEDDLSKDGRLREKLKFVPANALLSLVNTRWVITDKQFDAWIDGIFYDLQFPARLRPGQTIATTDIPSFRATNIGFVSHLEGAAAISGGTPVAKISVTQADGTQTGFTLRAGPDTAEGDYPNNAAHPQAKIGVTWPYETGGVDYILVQKLPSAAQITRIEAASTLAAGQFVLRGISLIHGPTTTSRSVILSTEGDYRLAHSGDVKVYENRNALPRAFALHRSLRVAGDDEAVAAMRAPGFDPARVLVLTGDGPPGATTLGEPSAADAVAVVSYRPEQVKLQAQLESPGWVLLTDTHYPGWQATVDGKSAQILTADLLFRAVEVPAGEHTIIFTFQPASLRRGAWLSGLALLVLAAGLALSRRQSR